MLEDVRGISALTIGCHKWHKLQAALYIVYLLFRQASTSTQLTDNYAQSGIFSWTYWVKKISTDYEAKLDNWNEYLKWLSPTRLEGNMSGLNACTSNDDFINQSL